MLFTYYSIIRGCLGVLLTYYLIVIGSLSMSVTYLHQKRHQLERAWLKTLNDNNRLLYHNQCQLYNSLLKKALSNYFASLIVSCSDSRSLWYSFEKVLHRSTTSNSDPPASLFAHQFSSFFTDKIKSLCANLPLIDVNLFSIPDQPAPIFSSFKPVITADIRNLISSSPKSTCLSDPVSYKLLPYCVDVPVVSHIINLSLSTGTFPNDLKAAFV